MYCRDKALYIYSITQTYKIIKMFFIKHKISKIFCVYVNSLFYIGICKISYSCELYPGTYSLARLISIIEYTTASTDGANVIVEAIAVVNIRQSP